MTHPKYTEIVIPRCRDSKTAFVESCVVSLLDQIKCKYRTLGKASNHISRDTLYGLEKKLGKQKDISAITVFNLTVTSGYDGVLIRYCSEDCVCKDTKPE